MKRKIIYIVIGTAILISCKSGNPGQPVNITAVKQSIDSLMDRNLKSWSSKEPGAMNNILADNGLFCGTDPGEFWDKHSLLDMWNQMISDTVNFTYKVDKREIRVAPDGKSAIVVEQFILPAFSPDIPERTVYHLIRKGDSWQFDFISWSFIPKNEDLPKLSKAIE